MDTRAQGRDTIDIGGVDLTTNEAFVHGMPHDAFARLRATAPVSFHREIDGPGFWACMSHADALTISRDTETFSSERGGVMIADSPDDQLTQMRQMMLMMDPPRQTRYRRIVNKGFTPRHVAELNVRIEQMARDIVASVARRGSCDFVRDVAGELPSMVIADLMGIPLDHGRMLYALTEMMHTTAETGGPPPDAIDPQMQMFAYSHALMERKRADPGDDIASSLLHAEVDGERLSDMEFNLFFMLLINAGGDTTRNLVANGVRALVENPAQYARLRAEPQLLDTAIEEMLRYVPPVIVFRRTLMRDVELGGVALREGEKVAMFYPAANRDEHVFVDAQRFDVGRDPNPHVAFGGGGAHFCLGANLARVEIRALIHEVLTHLDDIELVGEPESLHSNFIFGMHAMPVRFSSRP